MIYPIQRYGASMILEKKATRKIDIFGLELKTLVDSMFDTMHAAKGVGLAAPQIGILSRIAVIDLTFNEINARFTLVNPEIIKSSGTQTSDEGCLSIPGRIEQITRAMKVTVRAQDIHGEFQTITGTGLLARAIQHEIDHLDGILFISHLKKV